MSMAALGVGAALATMLATPIQDPPLLEPDRSHYLAPLAWDECDGALADWREPRPLVVLVDQEELPGGRPIPGMGGTAFALYGDGTVFTRQLRSDRLGLLRSRLPADAVARLLASLDLPGLSRLPEQQFQAPSPSPPGTIVCDGGPERLALHVWVDGCRRTIEVTNLSASALDWVVEGAPKDRLARETRARVRRALDALPPALAAALRRLVTFRSERGQAECQGSGCFETSHQLPNQAAWRD
jgi:hypothetical protein